MVQSGRPRPGPETDFPDPAADAAWRGHWQRKMSRRRADAALLAVNTLVWGATFVLAKAALVRYLRRSSFWRHDSAWQRWPCACVFRSCSADAADPAPCRRRGAYRTLPVSAGSCSKPSACSTPRRQIGIHHGTDHCDGTFARLRSSIATGPGFRSWLGSGGHGGDGTADIGRPIRFHQPRRPADASGSGGFCGPHRDAGTFFGVDGI